MNSSSGIKVGDFVDVVGKDSEPRTGLVIKVNVTGAMELGKGCRFTFDVLYENNLEDRELPVEVVTVSPHNSSRASYVLQNIYAVSTAPLHRCPLCSLSM